MTTDQMVSVPPVWPTGARRKRKWTRLLKVADERCVAVRTQLPLPCPVMQRILLFYRLLIKESKQSKPSTRNDASGVSENRTTWNDATVYSECLDPLLVWRTQVWVTGAAAAAPREDDKDGGTAKAVRMGTDSVFATRRLVTQRCRRDTRLWDPSPPDQTARRTLRDAGTRVGEEQRLVARSHRKPRRQIRAAGFAPPPTHRTPFYWGI